ncbi:uncharacterized protein V6R79_014311 [Siganus canaliculatus]
MEQEVTAEGGHSGPCWRRQAGGRLPGPTALRLQLTAADWAEKDLVPEDRSSGSKVHRQTDGAGDGATHDNQSLPCEDRDSQDSTGLRSCLGPDGSSWSTTPKQANTEE